MDVKEILEQFETGLEGVTPGPWMCVEVKTQVGRAFRIGACEMIEKGKGACIIYDDYPGDPDNQRSRNAAHIARCDPDTMRAIIAHIRELEARADNAEKAFVAVIKTMSDEARKRGEAEGRLEASEMAGVVDGWKARAEAAEAKVAMAQNLLKRVPGAINSAFAAGTEEREGGSDRRQAKAMAGPGILQQEIRAVLTVMEATDE